MFLGGTNIDILKYNVIVYSAHKEGLFVTVAYVFEVALEGKPLYGAFLENGTDIACPTINELADKLAELMATLRAGSESFEVVWISFEPPGDIIDIGDGSPRLTSRLLREERQAFMAAYTKKPDAVESFLRDI